MKANELPLDRILELFDVDTQNGELTRKVSRGRCKAGAVAGSLVNGYVQVGIYGNLYYLHRIIYAVHHNIVLGPDDQIDHINHDKSDNRISNLRPVSHQDNNQHRKIHKTKPYGVNYHKKNKNWQALIFETKTHPISFNKSGFPTMKDAYEVTRREHLRIRGSYPLNDAYWKALWNLQ